MIKTFLAALTAGSLFLAAACGGRVAQPVLIEQSYDSKLSCTHLSGELSNNDKRLVELKAERDGKPARNLGFLVASPLFLDLSESQKKEVEALIARNERIRTLMSDKNCDGA